MSLTLNGVLEREKQLYYLLLQMSFVVRYLMFCDDDEVK
jgi:hypothetical protein